MPTTKAITLNHGPLRLEGEFTICDADGREFGLAGRTVISLCRCGHSQNKPFCDGSPAVKDFNRKSKPELPPPKPKL
jgi:CDGSH-type Zn-finger protein